MPHANRILDIPYLGTNIFPTKAFFQDDFPFPKVEYLSSLEGVAYMS